MSELSTLPEPTLREALAACCGASPWVDAMLATRPWPSAGALLVAADHAWDALTNEQRAEAVAHHPRLGESHAATSLSARASQWAAAEQSGAAAADAAAREALAEGNAAYERRFGHTFILCASGKRATEMVEALRGRMGNDPATELEVTARELHRITRLRLEKLLG